MAPAQRGRAADKPTDVKGAKRRASTLEADRDAHKKRMKTIDDRIKEIDSQIRSLEAEKKKLQTEKAAAGAKQAVEVKVAFTNAEVHEPHDEEKPSTSGGAAARGGRGAAAAAAKKKGGAAAAGSKKPATKAEQKDEKSESEVSDVPKKAAASPKKSVSPAKPKPAAPKPKSAPKSPAKGTHAWKHEDETPADLPTGAKVFAQWFKGFYPAEIKDSDVSRVKVFFFEDKITKWMPKNAVFPLAKLGTGDKLMISSSDADAIGVEVEVVKVPSGGSGEPKFTVREETTKDEKSVSWQQIYFTKDQQEELLGGAAASASSTASRRKK